MYGAVALERELRLRAYLIVAVRHLINNYGLISIGVQLIVAQIADFQSRFDDNIYIFKAQGSASKNIYIRLISGTSTLLVRIF